MQNILDKFNSSLTVPGSILKITEEVVEGKGL